MKKICCTLLALLLILCLAGCGSGGNVLDELLEGRPIDGVAEGTLGTAMHSVFFDYTVKEAYTCSEFCGYKAKGNYQLVVAKVTVTNTFESTIEMYDSDFKLRWGTDQWEYPLTWYIDEVVSEEQFPAIYTLEVEKSRTGLLVYEVPAGNLEYSLTYLEEFADSTKGDEFNVRFTAEDRTVDDGCNYIYPTDGAAQGGLKDTLCSVFFEYTVNDAWLCQEMGGCTPDGDSLLLVVDVTVRNVFGKDIIMYDNDFTISWGGENLDYEHPLSCYVEEDLGEGVFPQEYKLGNREIGNGLLVFEVPKGQTRFSLCYQEQFSDETKGDAFAVTFDAVSPYHYVLPTDGKATGVMGDVMCSVFFEYSVTDAYLCDSIGSYSAASGGKVLVLTVTVTNTFGSEITMYDSDFSIRWGKKDDHPITYYGWKLADDQQFPKEYTLAAGESRTGLLIFEVTKGYTDFSLDYVEKFANNTTGDSFSVEFSAAS